MTPTSLVAAVAPRTGKCYKMVYYTLYLSYANCQKLCYKEFVQTKNDEKSSERCLALKGLNKFILLNRVIPNARVFDTR